jgi:hypothetical protein
MIDATATAPTRIQVTSRKLNRRSWQGVDQQQVKRAARTIFRGPCRRKGNGQSRDRYQKPAAGLHEDRSRDA